MKRRRRFGGGASCRSLSLPRGAEPRCGFLTIDNARINPKTRGGRHMRVHTRRLFFKPRGFTAYPSQNCAARSPTASGRRACGRGAAPTPRSKCLLRRRSARNARRRLARLHRAPPSPRRPIRRSCPSSSPDHRCRRGGILSPLVNAPDVREISPFVLDTYAISPR